MIKSFLRKPVAIVAIFVTGLFCGVMVTQTLAQQPHMVAALQALRSARTQLNEAAPDKAGHRVNALSLIDQAIEQVRLGIRAGAM
jgi:hypothetical protein